MTLRMVFDREDLQRVRVAEGPDPMWELALSIQAAQVRAVPGPLVTWRREFDRRLAGARPGRDALAPLWDLIAPVGAFPDFLTPPGQVTSLDAGCDAVLRTSPQLLGADLSATFARRAVPGWVRSLAAGDRGVLRNVVRAIRCAHDLLVAPHWPEIRAVVAADRAARTSRLAVDGVGAVLAGLPGVRSWDGRVLRTRYPVDRVVHLRGRGLTLIPSYFCWGSPVTFIDTELPPVLVYQAHANRNRAVASVSKHLVSILGRTRAECLHVLLAPRTTTELAQHLGISVSTASKQAAILRDTGLITSNRRGAAVLHSTTPLGIELLVGSGAPRCPLPAAPHRPVPGRA